MKNNIISYNQPNIDNTDISSVVKVLKSKNLTQGKVSSLFENAIIRYTIQNTVYSLIVPQQR